jgi:chaperonin GroEL (HSP60 family)
LLQIQTGSGEVTITNDGATILKQMSVTHPAAKMVNLNGVTKKNSMV